MLIKLIAKYHFEIKDKKKNY